MKINFLQMTIANTKLNPFHYSNSHFTHKPSPFLPSHQLKKNQFIHNFHSSFNKSNHYPIATTNPKHKNSKPTKKNLKGKKFHKFNQMGIQKTSKKTPKKTKNSA